MMGVKFFPAARHCLQVACLSPNSSSHASQSMSWLERTLGSSQVHFFEHVFV